MIKIPISDPEVLKKAKAFSQFREQCKSYLTAVGMNYDKFTVVAHDSFIGYISEYVIRQYIKDYLPKTNFKVLSWEEYCEIKNIYHAVINNDYSKAQLVKEYFYDKFDICIETPKRIINIDVKTALTQLEPTLKWDFLYPIIQAHKEGKDITILAYCIYKAPNKYEINIVDVIGYCDNKSISSCKVIKAGEVTKHGTTSQIDNYETLLGRDYKDLNELLDKLKEDQI